MNTAQPIRSKEELERFKNYYRITSPHKRNYLLLITGLNTALRISDVLKLQWRDVYDFNHKRFRSHICLTEEKTDKFTKIYMNDVLLKVLKSYFNSLSASRRKPSSYIFCGNSDKPISRIQAFRIVKKAAIACDIPGSISPHSLRKTFGYFAWKSGTSPVMLMNIFNHSSFDITKRYLGIEQDEKDSVFKNIKL